MAHSIGRSTLILGLALAVVAQARVAHAVMQTQDFPVVDGQFAECVGISCQQAPIISGGVIEFTFDAGTPPFPGTLTFLRDDPSPDLGPFPGFLTGGQFDFVGLFEIDSFTSATLRYINPTEVLVTLGGNSGPLFFDYTLHGVVVPEPSTLLLLGSGIAGLVLFGRTKRS